MAKPSHLAYESANSRQSRNLVSPGLSYTSPEMSVLGRTDAFAACFRNGRSWRLPSVPGPNRNARFGSTTDLIARPPRGLPGLTALVREVAGSRRWRRDGAVAGAAVSWASASPKR